MLLFDTGLETLFLLLDTKHKVYELNLQTKTFEFYFNEIRLILKYTNLRLYLSKYSNLLCKKQYF